MTAPRSFGEAFTEARADKVKPNWQIVGERDSARDWAVVLEGQNAQLEAQIAAVKEIRGCLGAGPMDYEMFVDELDDILAGTSPRPIVAALTGGGDDARP